MKFIIIIYTTNKLTVVEMEDIRGVRLRKFKLRKIVLGVRMHFHHNIPLKLPVYLVPFLRYSASKNGVTLQAYSSNVHHFRVI